MTISRRPVGIEMIGEPQFPQKCRSTCTVPTGHRRGRRTSALFPCAKSFGSGHQVDRKRSTTLPLTVVAVAHSSSNDVAGDGVGHLAAEALSSHRHDAMVASHFCGSVG